MNTFLILTAPFALVVVLTGILFYWMPRLTRPDLYFAVTVPADFRDSVDGRALLGGYRVKVVLGSLAALVVLAAGGLRNSLALLVAALIVQDGGVLLAYFSGRGQVKPHALEPSTVREAALAPRSESLPGGWLAQSGPFILLAATAVYLRQNWSAIPERFPIHWGLDGQPNGWAARTPAGVYGPLFIAAALCVMFIGIAYGVLRASRPIRLEGAAAHAEGHFRSTVAGLLLAGEYLLALMFAWTGLLPPTHAVKGPPGIWAVFALSLVFVGVVIVLFVRLGQGGMRAVQDSEGSPLREERQPVGDRTADRYWKAGLLYFNAEDPAIFVEKRFGIGYTLNFGHPASWIMLAALVLLPVVIGLVVKWGGK